MDKIAIVILNWNGKKMLQTFLPTVLEHLGEDAVVYVADNASTDGSVDYLKSDFPEVKLILFDKNWGFADGYNKALKQIDAEYFVLLNSDVEVTDNWLAPLMDFMDGHPEVAACQPKLLSVRNKKAFEYAGASGGFIDRDGYPFCRGRIFEAVEDDKGQYDDAVEVLWATGACLMIRAADYFAIGGLDGRFFAHNEEIDMCWRLNLSGRKVCCVPRSCVYHVGGGTLPKDNPMKTYLNFRNNLTMLYKNLPEKELKSVMRRRWFLDYLAAVQTLVLNRHWGDCKAIFRARRDFKRWLPQFQKDRERIQTMQQAGKVDGRKPYSILWQYYAKGVRSFSQLP